MRILFFVVFLVEDHACQGAIDPSRPLVETLVRPLTLNEQFIAIEVHYSLGHGVLQLEGEHCHFEELAFGLLSLLDALDPRRSRAPITRHSLRVVLPTEATLTVCHANLNTCTMLLPLGGH